jgi:octaprenyl-diphosphate synthase|tara:strand:+ start:11497 stop:12471 length:975 start_codon:yes stop_codon:yes gene_type:complete
MSIQIKDIQLPVQREMMDFEKTFRKSMVSNVKLLDKIMSYIIKRKGKQMRPLFVFLTAGMTGQINESTHRGAALIELLHTASLVHDDVVDDAHYRRGFFSINALWKNKIAVLVGDFLLSRGLLLALKNNDFDLLKIVSNAVQQMSEGELLQMEKARKLDITEELYYEVIRQKTASLISSCCQVGASSSGSTQLEVDKMGQFGTKVGMAFQIKDDLFDYDNAAIGKSTGIDIREKKLTLPLIFALQQSTKSEVSRIKKLISSSEKNPKNVKIVVSFVEEKGGIDYAYKVMNRYLYESLEILETYPETPYRKALEQLVQFTIVRKK